MDSAHRGPWLDIVNRHSSSTRFIPIITDLKNSAIKRIINSKTTGCESNDELFSGTYPSLIQTLSFLQTELGQSFDLETANENPFYALNEIFKLFAASEHQFLNLMEAKVQKQGPMDEDRQESISEIQQMKKLVDQHVEQLQDILEIVKSRGGRSWPRVTNSDGNEADEAVERLTSTVNKLTRRSQAVSQSCNDAMSMLSNEAVVREAQKSIKQAEGLAKVTFIAFVFVPLSFTTSFFGMNFVEFDPEKLHMWIWFAVSIPVLILSLVAWSIDGKKLRYAWNNIKYHLGPRNKALT